MITPLHELALDQEALLCERLCAKHHGRNVRARDGVGLHCSSCGCRRRFGRAGVETPAAQSSGWRGTAAKPRRLRDSRDTRPAGRQSTAAQPAY